MCLFCCDGWGGAHSTEWVPGLRMSRPETVFTPLWRLGVMKDHSKSAKQVRQQPCSSPTRPGWTKMVLKGIHAARKSTAYQVLSPTQNRNSLFVVSVTHQVKSFRHLVFPFSMWNHLWCEIALFLSKCSFPPLHSKCWTLPICFYVLT